MHTIVIVALIAVAGILIMSPETILPKGTHAAIDQLREHARLIAVVCVVVAVYVQYESEKPVAVGSAPSVAFPSSSTLQSQSLATSQTPSS